MSDFDIDALFIEPRPDEDAWEAFLDFALDRIGGERSSGLSNRQIGELEAVIGCLLPFEVGLLLVMGVPRDDNWLQWDDPEADFASWNEKVLAGICFDVEHDDFWFAEWGPRPGVLAARLDRARAAFAHHIPPLFPIYGRCAVPLTAADGAANSDGNPVWSVDRTDVTARGDDLAAWMHGEFAVPLPMWPSEERRFPFWTELIEQ